MAGFIYRTIKLALLQQALWHTVSAVKEMYLDAWADGFSTAGFAVRVYDKRNLGAREGEPRQEIDPWQQVQDYRDAITYVSSLPQDPVTDGGRGTIT